MTATIVVAALIFLYAAYIIRKKIRDIKAGRFCCGDCGGCQGCGGRSCAGNIEKTGGKTTR